MWLEGREAIEEARREEERRGARGEARERGRREREERGEGERERERGREEREREAILMLRKKKAKKIILKKEINSNYFSQNKPS